MELVSGDQSERHVSTVLLYQKAADLLTRVNSALSNDTSSIGTSNAMPINFSLSHPNNVLNLSEAIPTRLENLTLDNEVQLILDGVPEIQFGDDTVTDDLVDHLLKLGGKPPSQLQLPTAQINQHEILKTLQEVARMRISLKNLSVFSARYGLRKEGTFFIVKTPAYYQISLGYNPYHEPPNPDLDDYLSSNVGKKPKVVPHMKTAGETKKIMLTELQMLEEPTPAIIRRNNKKDSIKKFFTGDCDLHHSIVTNISITDNLLQDWLRNENLIEIELYGSVPPQGTLLRGLSVGPSCFARAKINPINLLTCPELDAMINLDLIADKVTLSDVTQRMQLLLAGARVKPLSDRMGILSARLTLLRGNSDQESHEEKFDRPERTIPHEIVLPKSVSQEPQFHAPEDSALLFTPNQANKAIADVLISTPAETVRTALDRQPKPLPKKEVFLGIAVLAMTGDVVENTLRHILQQHSQPFENDCLCVRFKVSKEHSDVLRIPLIHCLPDRDQPNALLMPLGKLVSMKERLDHPPFLEVWLELTHEEEQSQSERHLLAWTSRKSPVLFHQLSKIPLLDPSTFEPCGTLHAIFYQHEYPYFIEEKLQQQLNEFSLSPLPTISVPVKILESVFPNKADTANDSPQVFVSTENFPTNTLEEPRLRSESTVSVDSLGDSSGNKSSLLLSALELSVPHVSQNLANQHDDKSDTIGNQKELERPRTSASWQGKETFVVDIVPHGICSVFGQSVPSSSASATSLSMGCFVCYSFPALCDSSHLEPGSVGTRMVHFPNDFVIRAEQNMFSLWWDADCAILNGRNRHSISLVSTPITVAELARSLGVDQNVGWEVYIVGSDMDGNLLRNNSYLSCGTINLEDIVDCLNETTMHETILVVPLKSNPAVDGLKPTTRDMIPVELQLRLSWRREPISIHKLSQQTQVEEMNSSNANSQSQPILKKENIQIQPLPLQKILPVSFHQEFCLPSYSVTVLAFHHLKMKPLDISVHSHNRCELLYSLQYAGDIMAANMPGNMTKILDKIAYPENFRVISSSFSGPKEGRIEVIQNHRVHTPIRRSTLPYEDILQRNSGNSRISTFANTFSALGSLTLSLFERNLLFPSLSDNAAPGFFGPTGLIQATDVLLGVAAVDLDVLLRGMPFVEGWYNLMDSKQSVVGQVLLRVEPLEIDNREFDIDTRDSSQSERVDAFQSTVPWKVEGHDGYSSRLSADNIALPILDSSDFGEQEKLLDITGIEKDYLQAKLADLEATREHLYVMFGMKPALEVPPTEKSSFVESPARAPSIDSNTDPYSSDFESEASVNSLTVRDGVVNSNNHKTGIESFVNRHTMSELENFVAELDAARSPTMSPSRHISGPLRTQITDQNLTDNSNEKEDELMEEKEIHLDREHGDKYPNSQQYDSEMDYEQEYSESEVLLQSFHSAETENKSNLENFDDVPEEGVSCEEDIELLRTVSTPNVSYLTITPADTTSALLINSDIVKSTVEEPEFDLTNDAPFAVAANEKPVEAMFGASGASLQLDSILDLLQYHTDEKSEQKEPGQDLISNFVPSTENNNEVAVPPKASEQSEISLLSAEEESFGASNLSSSKFPLQISQTDSALSLHFDAKCDASVEVHENGKENEVEEIPNEESIVSQEISLSEYQQPFDEADARKILLDNDVPDSIKDVTSPFPLLTLESTGKQKDVDAPIEVNESGHHSVDIAISPIRVLSPHPISKLSIAAVADSAPVFPSPIVPTVHQDERTSEQEVPSRPIQFQEIALTVSPMQTAAAATAKVETGASIHVTAESGAYSSSLESLLPAQVLRRIVHSSAVSSSSSTASSTTASASVAVRGLTQQSKQRRKMDEETERIAKIMRGVLSSK